jgi:hypothetical protein
VFRPEVVPVVLVLLGNHQLLKRRLEEVLHVADISRRAHDRVCTDLLQTLDIGEPSKRAIGGYCSAQELAGDVGVGMRGEREGPRLSAAITTPPLYFMATTEVPVTIGCCVCWFGMFAARWEWS